MTSTNLLFNVLAFSSIKHANQRRKNSQKHPYINHPIDVAKIISNAGCDDVDILSSALLHDTVEDTGTTYQELVDNFGERIAKIVMECTDNKKLDKVTRKVQQIEHSLHISKEAKMVKLADKISNLSNLLQDPPTNWSPSEIKGYAIWSYAVCRNMFGVNDKLDQQIKSIFDGFNIFEGFNINDIMNDEQKLNDELKKYYQGIDKSD
jgi:(p)ppGpp synthase/HD superfamily hydrolase